MVEVRGYTEDDVDVLADVFAVQIQEALKRAIQRTIDQIRPAVTASEIFHLAGKHNQKDHGRGYRSGHSLMNDDQGVAERALSSGVGNVGEQDHAFHLIAAEQGFDGLPGVVSSSGMDDLIASGQPALYRGVRPGGGKTPTEIHDQLREGSAYFGSGLYGSGIYAGSHEHAVGFAGGKNATPDRVVRVTIRPEARVTDYTSLQSEMSTYRTRVDSEEFQNPHTGI